VTDDSSMGLFSFRLPTGLVRQIDELADRDRKRRADLVREARAGYVAERTAPVARHDAERALDVLKQYLSKNVTEE